MNLILAELKKIKRKASIPIVSILFFALFLVIFNSRVVNHNSGVYDPSMSNPYKLLSLFLLIFIVFNALWGIIIGSIISGGEFTYKTWDVTLKNSSRLNSVIAKIIATIIICVTYIFLIVLLAFILGASASISSFSKIDVLLFLKQLIVTLFFTFTTTMIGFLFSFIFKSHTTGSLVGVIFLYSPFYLGQYISNIKYIWPFWYEMPLLSNTFWNVNNKFGIQLGNDNSLPIYINLLIIFGLLVFIITFIFYRIKHIEL